MRMFHNSFSPVGEPSRSRCNLPGELAGETRSDARMASEGHRATKKKNAPLTVGRGPVPRQHSRASVIQRSRGTGPRATGKNVPITVGRGPVPRQHSRARPYRAGSSEALADLPSDPDPFVIRRAQTTAEEKHIVTMEIAGDRPPRYEKNAPFTVARGPVPRHAVEDEHSRGTGPRATIRNARPHRSARACPSPAFARTPTIAGDRPPRYDKKRPLHRSARACPSPSSAHSNARGRQAPALRAHRDREGSPTGKASRLGGLPY